MSEKVLKFFDMLAGHYENITSRSANDDGKFVTVMGCPVILAGGVTSFFNRGYFLGTSMVLLGLSILTYSVFVVNHYTVVMMRERLRSESSFLICMMINQVVCIMIPSSDHVENFAINLGCVGFIIHCLGQFFFASNPKPPEKKTKFTYQVV